VDLGPTTVVGLKSTLGHGGKLLDTDPVYTGENCSRTGTLKNKPEISWGQTKYNAKELFTAKSLGSEDPP
jgi:hypothetical protein